MKCHVILNICPDFAAHCEDIFGFFKKNDQELEEGNVYLIDTGTEEDNDYLELIPFKKVIQIRCEHYQPESILNKLALHFQNGEKAVYLLPSNYTGDELAVRLSYRLQGSSLLHIKQIHWEYGQLEAEKMVYSNHMNGQFSMKKAPYFFTLEKGCGSVENKNSEKIMVKHFIEKWDISEEDSNFTEVINFQKKEKEEGINHAKIILAAGRGVKKKEEMESIKQLAKCMGGDYGVSRPAAMSAWAPMNRLIGVSGAMTKPEITMTVGISGAAAFFAGIEKSQFIVAMNTDPDAPIVKKADVVIIDDYKPILSELFRFMKEEKTKQDELG